jgi:hypothetical protein
VELGAGRHQLPPGGLRLGVADSGHGPGCEAVWSSSGGTAAAVLSGGRAVPGPWRLFSAARDVWSAPLPGAPDEVSPGPRQLYVGSRRATRARSPINTSLTHKHGMQGQWIPGCLINSSNPRGCLFNMTRTGFVLQTAAPLPAATYCNCNSTHICELEMAWTGRADAWNAPRCPVRAIHASTSTTSAVAATATTSASSMMHRTEFVMAQPCWENGAYRKPHVGAIRELPVFLENAVELVTQPGDFATAGGTVFYKPVEPSYGRPPTGAVVPAELHLLTLNRTEWVQFRGLVIELGGWPSPSGGDGFIDVQAAHRLFGNATFAPHCQLPRGPGQLPGHGGPPCAAPTPAHVAVRASRHIVFDEMTFRKMGAVALNVSGGSQEVRIDSCQFEQVSSTALELGQTDDWAETVLAKQNARLTVQNCTVRNATMEFGGAVGIFVGFVRDSIISQNTIDSPAKACVSLGWGWGTAAPSYMANNSVTHNLCVRGNAQCCGGMGVMYTLGSMPNTTLAYNYVLDAHRVWAGVGFHHDEGTSGVLDYQNVVDHAPALDKIHVTFLDGNLSHPLTRNITVSGCWTNTHPVADHRTGAPEWLKFVGNTYVNTTAGESWPAAAMQVMRAAGAQPPPKPHSAAERNV